MLADCDKNIRARINNNKQNIFKAKQHFNKQIKHQTQMKYFFRFMFDSNHLIYPFKFVVQLQYFILFEQF